MSGRRLRNTVRKTLLDNGFTSNVTVVIAGLSNTYSDYVTTFEEYQVLQTLLGRSSFEFAYNIASVQVQRYEGASTDYGPYTLDAYLQEFGKLAVLLAKVCNQSIIVVCGHTRLGT